MYNALEALAVLGICTRIALYYGDTASGMDYTDGASPCGNNAFAVYRWETNAGRTWNWYLLIQYSYAAYPQTGSGSPVKILTSSGSTGTNIGVQCAVGLDAGGATASPWAGGTANAGADAKAANVWADPGGGCYVWPRCNNLGGSAPYPTNKHNLVQINSSTSGSSSVNARYHLIADDDCIAFLTDVTDTSVYTLGVVIAPFTPLFGLSVETPLAMLASNALPFANASIFGTTTGNGAQEGGAQEARNNRPSMIYIDVPTKASSSAYQPNSQFNPAQYVEHQFAIYQGDGYAGLVGYLDSFARYSYNVPTHSTLNTRARVVFGTATQAEAKLTLPWDGVSADPGALTTRDGVTF
jgi:hypothetical protein